jgi:CO/xanthine dehydrogenase FAD-binding subunit
MIEEYFRPKTLNEALKLIKDHSPRAYPLGGGSYLSRHAEEAYTVVDLQDLSLNTIERQGNILSIGATCTLDSLFRHAYVSAELREAIRQETNFNLRQVATVAGVIVTADGFSTLATALLALDAHLYWMPGEEDISLGDWLALRHDSPLDGLITRVTLSLNAYLKYASVSRTPDDRPILCVGIGKWPSGRTRIAIGAGGKAPVLAMDGPISEGAEIAAEDACSQLMKMTSINQYQQEVTHTLVKRLLSE